MTQVISRVTQTFCIKRSLVNACHINLWVNHQMNFFSIFSEKGFRIQEFSRRFAQSAGLVTSLLIFKRELATQFSLVLLVCLANLLAKNKKTKNFKMSNVEVLTTDNHSVCCHSGTNEPWPSSDCFGKTPVFLQSIQRSKGAARGSEPIDKLICIL